MKPKLEFRPILAAVVVGLVGTCLGGANTVSDDSHAVQGKIYEVEPLGAYTVVDVSVGDGLMRAQITGQPRFELGEPVFLSIERGKCHLFDGESGERLATGTAD